MGSGKREALWSPSLSDKVVSIQGTFSFKRCARMLGTSFIVKMAQRLVKRNNISEFSAGAKERAEMN